jgi:FkbM family methyltransferase
MKNLFKIAFHHYRTEGQKKFFLRILRFLTREINEIQKRISLWFWKLRFGDNYSVKDILGSKMYLNLKDKGISTDLIAFGIREHLVTNAIKKLLKKGEIVVDIGANIGYYALLGAKLVGEEGKVFAIEPVVENIEILKKNILLNNYSNIEVFKLAIGDKNQEGEIYLSEYSNLASLIDRKKFETGEKIKKEKVKIVTLDKFLEDKPLPDLVRMDVEGYEYEVIKGMENLLKTKKSFKIFAEIHLDNSPESKERIFEILDILAHYGFKLKIGVWPDLGIQNRLLFDLYCYLSKKIGFEDCGYFYAEDLKELKTLFRNKVSYPQLIFER